MVLNDFEDGESAALALLNGPTVGKLPEGEEVTFGGTSQLGAYSERVLEVGGDGVTINVLGSVLFLPGVLSKLASLGALEVAKGVQLRELLAVPASERWRVAGGRIDSLEEAALAAAGDVQRRKWYQRFLGLDVELDQ